MMDGAGDRVRDVLCTRGLVGPLHVRLWPDGGVTIGQVGLHRDLRAHLLPGRDQQGRLVRLCVEDPADRVADAGGGVQVDVRRATARLSKAVGHPHHHELLQPEHI